MSMVKKLRNPAGNKIFRPGRVAGRATLIASVCLSLAATLPAQTPGGYYCLPGVALPGAIGSQQLQRGGPLHGFSCVNGQMPNGNAFQPVEIRAPGGISISMASEGTFERPQPAPSRVGMLVGPVYRFRVMNIPFTPGIEVFPTVEIVDRLYPPPGQKLQFPIPVELTAEELQMAADGKFVTRVIYVEDPHAAVPVADDEKHQSWFDVGPGESPLKVARNLGRPVAVLRLGGRLPDPDVGVDMGFLCGCPPLVHFSPSNTPAKAPPRAQKSNTRRELPR